MNNNRRFQFLALTALVAASVTAGMFLASGLDMTPTAAAKDSLTAPREAQPAHSLPGFADIVEQANPAVVGITSTALVRPGDRTGQFFHNFRDPFEFFFGPDRRRPAPDDEEERREAPDRREDSGGSGFIISDDGYILTNHHVVEGADRIEVTLEEDTRSYSATVVGSDPMTDIALLKVDAGRRLPVIPLGDSEGLRVGEWVVAIGNPLFWDHTVTVGVVSAKGRRLPSSSRDTSFDDFIQTDAAINFGNSGGPLLNLYGEAIGINTAISSSGQGIGFAIPINMAKDIMDQLKEHGRVSRGYLGIEIRDIAQLPAEDKEYFGLTEVRGAFVSSVATGLPAERAGVQHGDAIVAVDGRPIRSSSELISAITRRAPNDEVELEVLRDGKSLTLTATLVERAEAQADAAGPGGTERPEGRTEELLGFTVEGITPELARYYRLDPDLRGVIVTSVDALSEAYDKGLREGSIILEVNRNPIRSLAEFRREVEATERGGLINFYVRTGTFSRFLVLRLGDGAESR